MTHLAPFQKALNAVFRMKLELRAGCLTPERAERHLAALEAALAEASPGAESALGAVEMAAQAPRLLRDQPTPWRPRLDHVQRTPGVRHGHLFAIDGGLQ